MKIHLLLVLVFELFARTVSAQPDHFAVRIFGCASTTLDEFEEFTVRVKDAGATHVQIQAEDVPLSYWEMTPPGDPYPAWVITNPGILKTFIPEPLKPYIPAETAEAVFTLMEQRCAILRKHGLKAAFHTFEPQMLPEPVFVDHPDWRGPQVDHPTRSQTPRFAPSVDHPEIRLLYTEAMRKFIARCPEVDILVFRTNDSGAGFDWAPNLYYGQNGNNAYRSRSMRDRIRGFFEALQQGARDAGGNLAVHVYNTKDDARGLARGMEAGMALDWFEGPDAARFSADVDALLYYKRHFSPIVGIPRPFYFLEQLEGVEHSNAPRLFVSIADRQHTGLYLRIYDAFWQSPPRNDVERLQFMRKIAVEETGEEHAETHYGIWTALDEVRKLSDLMNVGGTLFTIGVVQQRWITRPLVPFPAELTQQEQDYYRKHQFTAREAEADNLLIMQGIRAYQGEGGKTFISRIIWRMQYYLGMAARNCRQLTQSLDGEQQREFQLLASRLEAFDCLMNTVNNVAGYQLRLDQIAEARRLTEAERMLLNQDGTALSEMIGLARSEIDNTVKLIKILESQVRISDVIDHAETRDQEYVRLLGPDLVDQLRKKVNIMNAHWMDYHRLFAVRNP